MNLYTFLSILYVLVCLFLILVVLLQPGRGGVGGAFGGGSSQTVFGGSGAGNFLTRLTSISAALFMILSATLAYMSSSTDKSLERAAEKRAAAEAQKKSKPDDKAKKEDKAAAPALAPAEGVSGEGEGESAPIEETPPATIGDAPAEAPAGDAPAAVPASDAPTLKQPVPAAPQKPGARLPAKPRGAAPKRPAGAAPAAGEAPPAEAPAPTE